MLVDHFALGLAHLVCARARVCPACAIRVPLTRWSTLVGTLQWGHQGCDIYGLLHDS